MKKFVFVVAILLFVVTAIMLLFLVAMYPVGMIGRSMYVMYATHVQTDTNVVDYSLTDVGDWAVDGIAGTESGNYGGALLLGLFAVAISLGYVVGRIQFARELQ